MKIRFQKKLVYTQNDLVTSTMVPISLCMIHTLLTSQCQACKATVRTKVCAVHVQKHILRCAKCRGKSHFVRKIVSKAAAV
jgi:hypothetical protein